MPLGGALSEPLEVRAHRITGRVLRDDTCQPVAIDVDQYPSVILPAQNKPGAFGQGSENV